MKCIHLVAIIVLIFGSSCETTVSLDYASLESTTGLVFTDANGNLVGSWRNHNNYSEGFAVFPNPSNGTLFLNAPIGIDKVWIVSSVCVTDDTNNIPDLIDQVAYDISDIEEQSQLDIDGAGSQNISIDLTSSAKGTYKVFCQLSNQQIRWISIYIDPSQTNFPNPGSLDFCN